MVRSDAVNKAGSNVLCLCGRGQGEITAGSCCGVASSPKWPSPTIKYKSYKSHIVYYCSFYANEVT